MSLDRRFLDVNLSVQGVVNEPPASVTPVKGMQYIVGAEPAGAFAAASANDIARYSRNKWRFTKPDTDSLELLNLGTLEVLRRNGTGWAVVARFGTEKPVLAVVATGTTLPETAETGEKFLNTTDGKVYVATAENTWDTGTVTDNGDRYGSATDAKIYTKVDGTFVGITLADGTLFLSKEDNSPYSYNAALSKLVRLGGGGSPVTESHVLTASEAAAKGFSLTKSIAAGTENSVQLAACGVVQTAGTDFTVSGSTVDWTNRGLDTIGLTEGDTFVITYTQA